MSSTINPDKFLASNKTITSKSEYILKSLKLVTMEEVTSQFLQSLDSRFLDIALKIDNLIEEELALLPKGISIATGSPLDKKITSQIRGKYVSFVIAMPMSLVEDLACQEQFLINQLKVKSVKTVEVTGEMVDSAKYSHLFDKSDTGLKRNFTRST